MSIEYILYPILLILLVIILYFVIMMIAFQIYSYKYDSRFHSWKVVFYGICFLTHLWIFGP